MVLVILMQLHLGNKGPGGPRTRVGYQNLVLIWHLYDWYVLDRIRTQISVVILVALKNA